MDDVAARLQERLSRPLSTAADADRAARAAEALATYLRAKEQVERFVDEIGAPEGASSGASLAGRTLNDAAERVLEDAGVPLHARELGKRIKARGWTHPRSTAAQPDQIVFQLAYRLPRDRHHRFRRVAPNTFALARWRGDGPAARPNPSVGLFSGPGGAVARSIDEAPERPAEDDPWRSS